nr:FecR family protein [Prevotella sp. PTAC]
MKTPRGECADVTLADGTRVWLNGESVLEFPNRFIGARREVRLSCEAYFDVAKDSCHPFIVTTDYYSVSVLGTSFSACAYSPSDAALVLAEWRVRMSSAAHVGSLVLTPGACNGYIVSSVGPIAQPTILCEYASVINDM